MSELTIDTSPKQMRRNILGLAWPAILRLFLQSIVGVVDVIMIGQLGAAAIASVDIGNRIVFVLIGSLMSLTIGATAMVAHYVGAGNKEEANHIMWQSLMSGFLAALILAFLGSLFSEEILKLMMVLMEEADQFIINEGSVYLKIVLASMIFGLPMMVINAILQGIGDMKTPLFIMFITNIINVLLNYLLIFGIGFFPALGVTGAALGTGIGRLVGFIIGLIVLIRGDIDIRLDWKQLSWKFDWETIKNILKIGIPAAIEQFARQSSQIIYTALVAGLGTMTIAANAVAMNVTTLSFMPGFGFGMAATTLIGQSLGAEKKDLAEKYGKQSAYLTVILMALASIAMFIWIQPIIHLYTDEPGVIKMATSALRIFLFFQPLFGLFMVLAGALRGAGDTKWVMYFTIIGNWGVRLIFSLIFAFYFKLGLNGFWLAMGVDVIVRAGLIVWRFLSGKWKDLKVVQNNEKMVIEILD
ncbi:MATE family efflux transporter [Iocasia frigidifontis]|uniref:Probable multidrug resistance protein NorM n=1 Tax=Iocasia fonsfrigidae TaxID=2682810 RepID=A0A8A7KHP7_9FIRM|nr:MATE family efflux transporter [Iocasia fonsfrigidae]QTL97402.1 MATE family efflux transporter [Iocasia fonsfrigidae]